MESMTEIAPRIVVDPTVRFGRPVIRGTRVPVALIGARLAAGMDVAEMMAEYDLTAEDVQAMLHYLDYLHMQKVKEQQPARLKLAEVKAALDFD